MNIKDIKVIFLGQDPYIKKNQATGLSFSVPIDSAIPPSLYNIYRELKIEFRFEEVGNCCLYIYIYL